MTLFRGVALMIPMLIMSLHPCLILDMITASVATVIFALVVAFGSIDSTWKDVLVSTAAYTAVLVVFVGASLALGSGAQRS